MRIEEFCGFTKNEVKVDMLCTIHYHSDSEPAKVVKVSSIGVAHKYYDWSF